MLFKDMIYALKGFPSILFPLIQDQHNTKCFKFDCGSTVISESLDSSDLDAIHRILEIATMYHSLTRSSDHIHPSKPGFYREVFEKSLEICITPYNDVILRLEQQVISSLENDPDETSQACDSKRFLGIYTQISHFYLLLATLQQLTQDVRQVHGIAVVDIIARHRCETPVSLIHISDALKSIHVAVLNVAFRQLVSWCCYGILSDPFHEFFIVQSTSAISASDNNHKSLKNVISLEWQSWQSVDLHQIPHSLLTEESANDVLFVGQAAALLRQYYHQENGFTDYEEDVFQLDSSFSVVLHAILSKTMQLIYALDDFRISRVILEVDRAMKRCKRRVSGYLWQIASTPSSLLFTDYSKNSVLTMFTTFRNGFLMLDVEFYDIFLQLHLDAMNMKSVKRDNIDKARSCWRRSGAIIADFRSKDDHGHREQLYWFEEFTFKRLPIVSQSDKQKNVLSHEFLGLNGALSLAYLWESPLHLILSLNILELYGRIFEQLFAVYKTLFMLRHYRRSRFCNRESMELCRQMCLLVESIWNFFQVYLLF